MGYNDYNCVNFMTRNSSIYKEGLPMKRFMALLLAIVLVCQAAPVWTIAAEAGDDGSIIKKLENVLGNFDLTKYFDSSTVYRLPDGIADDDEISVIISLDTATVLDAYEATDKTMSLGAFAQSDGAAQAVRDTIAAQTEKILAGLDKKGVSYRLGDSYDTVLAGFALTIRAADFESTCRALPKTARAILGEQYHAAETSLVENTVSINATTGIFDGSQSGFDGSGMVVAVLDTGIDYNHTAFSTDNFTSSRLAMTYQQLGGLLGQTTAAKLLPGLTADNVYISEKIPFGFDYADGDTDPYSTHNDHGTHVSGVIAGKDDTITGVAPNAQIVSMKIFSDTQDTAKSEWILSALEDCVVLGVDVINMSLGTSCGFSRQSDEEAINGVYDRIRDAGISLVAAASNSYSSAYGSEANGNLGLTANPDTGTVGSPSTYDSAFSVASISGTKTPYLLYQDTIVYFVEATNGASEEKNFCAELLGDQQEMTLEYVLIPGAGRTADYSGLDVKGKLVLVRRGSNTFEEKAIIAQQQGAAGIIIYNNVSGEIKMNVADARIPVCSISQTDGGMLAQAGSGKLTISVSQTSGPFISDFSSWGPTPSLGIKPEITAHGGNILSAITGGGYDRMSGTSMACPNLAGLVVLLKQYVTQTYPELAQDNRAVTAMIYQLLMSTADIALNKNGLPYAVRKQGAGLANLASALHTTGYITTIAADGSIMDKTKLELGDDADKTGVYTMTFRLHNIGTGSLSYDVGGYVMTEGVSDTKTNSGKTTVTEESYLLPGAKLELTQVSGGTAKGNRVTVEAGQTATVTVTVTLSDSDREYLDTSFENGMYVEGFVTLTAAAGTEIDLSVPYLAFYGDWEQAPLFDLDYFETDADEKDNSIAQEDKLLPDAYATRPIGGVMQDYIGYLGSYYFTQNPKDMTISAKREYSALSNQEGTVHSLRYVWAGLLRSAARVDTVITNDATGEVVFETTAKDVRKSFGEGGSIYPSSVEIGFDLFDYDLPNNTELTVSLTAYLDYGEDGGVDTNRKNTFTFPLTVDFEAPVVQNVRYYYEYDKTLKKNRLYADVDIYDNHYAMSSQLGYITETQDENGDPAMEIVTFDNYLTPIYSQRNSTTTVTYELTDYIYEMKEQASTGNSFVLTLYDYALNYATYEIDLPDQIESFSLGEMADGLTLSLNEVYTMEPEVEPVSQWSEFLKVVSSRPGVVRVVNNKLVAVGRGKAVIRVESPMTGQSTTFPVTVLGEGDEGYVAYDQPVADVFNLKGYYTLKAYYMLDNADRDIGSAGSTNFFGGNYSLSMYPSESVGVQLTLASYFPDDTKIVLESSNESIVKTDGSGIITAVAEGYASVTVRLTLDGKNTYYSETVSIEVKNPYLTTGPSLTHYFGNGGLVTIPEDLSLTQIGDFAFANFEYIDKTQQELDEDDKESTKQWFIGDSSITKVIIPEGVEKIGAYAFANLTALTEVVLPSTLTAIEYGAFYGCTALEKLTFSGENNLKIINRNAFENCALSGTLELGSVCIISDYAFANNQKLTGLVTGESLISIGSYAFAACGSLADVTITAGRVKYGTYAFTGCKALQDFTVHSVVLPEGMFYECESLTSVTLGAEVADVGEFAFRDTAVSTITVAAGNKTYLVQSGPCLLSADGSTLCAVAPSVTGTFDDTLLDGHTVTALGDGAFSHNRAITAVSLPRVTVVGDYAFGSARQLRQVELGTLEKIGDYAFYETGITTLPAFTAQTQMGSYAFAFSMITEVRVPAHMQVPEGAFSECAALTTVVVGDGATLGLYAFGMNKDDVFSVHSYDENGKKYFYYDFATALTDVTIGSDVTIGERAFACAASLERVTLGDNAKIDRMAFYNCRSLAEIDLSGVQSIGEYAFSGDVYYVCQDENMATAAVSADGYYIYTYFSPALTQVSLHAATQLDGYAFAYCRSLNRVELGAAVTELKPYTFAGCAALTELNLSGVKTIGEYALMETALTSADLSAAEQVGQYAFVDNKKLESVKLNAQGSVIEEGAFANDGALTEVENLQAVTEIGDWAFALTGLTKANLSAAQSIGKQAFLKEELTDFEVTLGEHLQTLGDNPFAMCRLAPFTRAGTTQLNGREQTVQLLDFAISDTVQVMDGSLYAAVPDGWVLITYTGGNVRDVKVPEDTVRIASMAFAGSDVQMITLPNTLSAIGHKAFYDCRALHTVIFGSHTAPVLEEEFDATWFDNMEHIPGAGDYGTYTDYTGEQVQIIGMGLVPYYMWNITGGLYSNVYYGASFVDYVGYVQQKLLMIRPENGQGYDSFVLAQYFDRVVDGPTAPDDITMAAIRAIAAIPERVVYADRALVEAARAAYDRIATLPQQALVGNYADLVTAEQRILALTPEEPVPEQPTVEAKPFPWVTVCVGSGIVLAAAALLVVFRNPLKTRLRRKNRQETPCVEEENHDEQDD